MTSEEQKLPMVVKVLIGLVILLFGLPILTLAPVLLQVLTQGPKSDADELSAWEGRSSPDLAITTTESVMFEWCQAAGTPEFKQISALVRETPPT